MKLNISNSSVMPMAQNKNTTNMEALSAQSCVNACQYANANEALSAVSCVNSCQYSATPQTDALLRSQIEV